MLAQLKRSLKLAGVELGLLHNTSQRARWDIPTMEWHNYNGLGVCVMIYPMAASLTLGRESFAEQNLLYFFRCVREALFRHTL